MSSLRARIALAASALLGCAALWRAAVAIRHYRISLGISDDPSMRELEQVSALFELGLAFLLLIHAVAAAYFVQHALRLDGVVVAAIAAVAAVSVTGAFWRLSGLRIPGLVPASLILGGALAGYFSRSPWISAYLGALVGSVAGVLVAAPSREPIAALAVTVPPVLVALVGVGLGRALRRLDPLRRAR
jgi:hypothetical protein